MRTNFGSTVYRQGWFADKLDPDDPHYNEEAPWAAFVQLYGYCPSIDGVWFRTQEDCESWIKENIIGLGMWDDA